MVGAVLEHLSFPKSKRLRSNEQFRTVLSRNLCTSNGLFTLYMAENGCNYPRLGVSVSKTCGNAFVRNRLKRLSREVFRRNQPKIPVGFDYVIIISPRAVKSDKMCNMRKLTEQLTFEQMQQSFFALLKFLSGKAG